LGNEKKNFTRGEGISTTCRPQTRGPEKEEGTFGKIMGRDKFIVPEMFDHPLTIGSRSLDEGKKVGCQLSSGNEISGKKRKPKKKKRKKVGLSTEERVE